MKYEKDKKDKEDKQDKEDKTDKGDKGDKMTNVSIKGGVIECPSISNMKDVAVTRTLGREGATYY